jgi:phosphoribosyl-AMP cyclohydrolase / phosphoribosyl-ATP pyrophosphohydrolase
MPKSIENLVMSASQSIFSISDIPLDQIRYDERGLVPAIVQDYLDGTVLMMAWMNRESLQKTLETGHTFKKYNPSAMTVTVMRCW